MSRDESPEVEHWEPVVVGAFSGVTGAFIEDDAAIREWYLGAESVLLTSVTYAT